MWDTEVKKDCCTKPDNCISAYNGCLRWKWNKF